MSHPYNLRQRRIAAFQKSAKQSSALSGDTKNDDIDDSLETLDSAPDTLIPNYRQLRLAAIQKSRTEIITTDTKEQKSEDTTVIRNYRQERIKKFQEENIYSQVLNPKSLRLFNIKDLQKILPDTWSCKQNPEILKNGTIFVKHTLEPFSMEYRNVQQKFATSLNAFQYQIKQIERVENPYLWFMYQLRKKDFEKLLGSREMQLFHGTATQNLDPICAENFNWRLNAGCSHGKGVYFGYAASTSLGYCRGGTSMFLARVMFAKLTTGGHGQLLPDPMCDATGVEASFYVKYGDYEYYPEYIIHF